MGAVSSSSGVRHAKQWPKVPKVMSVTSAGGTIISHCEVGTQLAAFECSQSIILVASTSGTPIASLKKKLLSNVSLSLRLDCSEFSLFTVVLLSHYFPLFATITEKAN